MLVRELLTKWGFQIETEKLDKTEHQLDRIKHALEFLAATEVVKGIYELGEKFAHFAEELHLAATAAGLGVEAFQKLAFAAKMSGVSQEEMSGALARLGRHLYDARQGSQEALLTFARVGFTQEQVRGFRTSQDAMAALADQVKATSDPIAKQAMLMHLLGRGSFNMVEFLNKGSAGMREMQGEASRLGVLSEKNVVALVGLEHAFQKIWGVIKYLSASLAGAFAPAIRLTIEQVLKLYESNKKLIDVNMREWGLKIAYVFGFLYGVFEDIIYIAMSAYHGFIEFSKAHPVFMRIAEALAFLVGGLLAFKQVLSFVSTGFGIFGKLFGLILNPVSKLGIAIGIMVVGFHDIYALLTGGKTWTQGFIEWLGIAQQVEDVMFAIFTIVEDLLNLDFSKLKLDFVGSLKDLGSFAIKTASTFVPAIGNLTGTPPSAAPTGGNASNTYQVNAPVTVNVPAGAEHGVVVQKVKEGIREHLDRVHREAQRSLRPVQAY